MTRNGTCSNFPWSYAVRNEFTAMGDGKVHDFSQQFHGDDNAWQNEEFHTTQQYFFMYMLLIHKIFELTSIVAMKSDGQWRILHAQRSTGRKSDEPKSDFSNL
jgi:hypothetical protein